MIVQQILITLAFATLAACASIFFDLRDIPVSGLLVLGVAALFFARCVAVMWPGVRFLFGLDRGRGD